jgi:CubicO group peptidase (beta-lactamase class C family)
VTKSVASLAIGTLLDSHVLSDLDATMASVLSEFSTDAAKSKITIRNLLSHTSGYGDWDTYSGTKGADLLKGIVGTPLVAPPDTKWLYSSMSAYLLGPIIERLSHLAADTYIQQNLFDRLDIHSARFDYGVDMGGGLFMETRDMAKIGDMMLHAGSSTSRAVVSAGWIEKSVNSSQGFFPDYGLLWWLYLPTKPSVDYQVFSAVGYQGQYIVVYPKANLIVIRVHRVEATTDPTRLAKIFWPNMPESVPNLIVH